MSLELEEMRAMHRQRIEFASQYPEGPIREFMLAVGARKALTELGTNSDFMFQSYYGLVHAYGDPPVRRTIDLHGYPAMEVQQCYHNCYKVIDFDPVMTYVEGYAQATGMVTGHAWLQEPDGTIIDPTWANLDVDPDFEITYWGIRFARHFVQERAEQTGYPSVLQADYLTDISVLQTGLLTDETGLAIALGGHLG